MQPIELTSHLECGKESTRRVVLVADGSTEHREQRVAGVLLDESAVTGYNISESRDNRVDGVRQLLRVEPRREVREAGDVGEDRSDETKLALLRMFHPDKVIGFRRLQKGQNGIEEPEVGFEPTAYALQGRCSDQLSYSGTAPSVPPVEASGARSPRRSSRTPWLPWRS